MSPKHTYLASTVAAFDYSAMPDDVVGDARAVVTRVRGRTEAFVIDTGRDLLAIKDRLDHGLFLQWLGSELGMQPRTAQNYMQAASAFGSESETVSHLPPTALYALASPGVPVPFRKEVIARLTAGEKLEPKMLVTLAKRAAVTRSKAVVRRSRNERMITDRLKELPLDERKALDTPEKRRARADELWEMDRQKRHAHQAAFLRRSERQHSERSAKEAEIGQFIRNRLSSDDLQTLIAMFSALDEEHRPGPFTFALRQAASRRAA